MKNYFGVALLMCAAPVWAQTTGVSAPPAENYTTEIAPAVKAAPAVVIAPESIPETIDVAKPVAAPTVMMAEVAPQRTALKPVQMDADAGIVTSVPSRENEVPEGALLKIKLNDEISTATTVAGSEFTGSITEAVEREGHVIIPVGAVLKGRVTQIRSGKRIGGQASIHLEPETVTLPDGTHYVVHAQVIDTDDFVNKKIDHEGTIVHRDHVKSTLAAMGLATGGAASAGAVLGGGVGAVVGAGVGVGVSTVVWLKQDHQTSLPKESTIVFSLRVPMIMTALKE